MTPKRLLEMAYQDLVTNTANGDPEYPTRIIVERDDELIALTFYIEPSLVKISIPLALMLFRADAASFISDAWVWHPSPGRFANEEELPYPPKVAFEKGEPGASEAIVVQHYARDGKLTAASIRYKRQGERLLRTGTDVLDKGRVEGRAVADQDWLDGVTRFQRVMVEAGDRMGVPQLGADMAAIRLLHQWTGQRWALYRAVDPEEAEKAEQAMRDVAEDMGYADLEMLKIQDEQ